MLPLSRTISTLSTLVLLWAVSLGAQPGDESDHSLTWPEGKKAALSLTFDDARPSQIDVGIPLLERKGVRVTFYVTPSRLKERADGWRNAVAQGHEMGNHSDSHPCSGNFPWSRNNALEDYSIDRIREDILTANRTIEDLLGVEAVTFAYPCGQKFVGRGERLESYVPFIARQFLVGRSWLNESLNDPAYVDLAQVMAIPSDDVDFEQVRPLVDQAVETGYWLILAGHDIDHTVGRQTTRVSMLEELLDYVAIPERGIWVDTVQAIGGHVRKGQAATAGREKGRTQ